jgi:hypothetical protein
MSGHEQFGRVVADSTFEAARIRLVRTCPPNGPYREAVYEVVGRRPETAFPTAYVLIRMRVDSPGEHVGLIATCSCDESDLLLWDKADLYEVGDLDGWDVLEPTPGPDEVIFEEPLWDADHPPRSWWELMKMYKKGRKR